MFSTVPVNSLLIPSFLSFSQVLSFKLDLPLPILSQARGPSQTFLPQPDHPQTLFSVELMFITQTLEHCLPKNLSQPHWPTQEIWLKTHPVVS